MYCCFSASLKQFQQLIQVPGLLKCMICYFLINLTLTAVDNIGDQISMNRKADLELGSEQT